MANLETKLVEAREKMIADDLDCVDAVEGFDIAAAIAREVVAEKDKRILELEDALDYNINELRDKIYEKDAEITRLEIALREDVAEKNTKITQLRNLVELRHSKQCENDECDLCEAAFV